MHDHAHGHHHNHAHGAGSGHKGRVVRRALLGSLLFNGGFLIIEAVAGFWTGSLALLSDAAHMVSDVAALAVALWVSHLATRPATPKQTFGLLRAEVLGAFVNAATLLVACVFIFKAAVERLMSGPPHVAGWPVLIVAVTGLAINLISAWMLWRSDSTNINVRGALAHMLADALGSVGAMLAALLTLFAGWMAADAVIGAVIGMMVLWGTWGILRDSTRVLLEFAPSGLDQGTVSEALSQIDGVAGVHELHVWTLGSGQACATAHLVLESEGNQSQVLKRAEKVLHADLGIPHTTLQVDPATEYECTQKECPLLAEAEGNGSHHPH